MKPNDLIFNTDTLYGLFEERLLFSDHEENVSVDAFIDKVVQDFILQLGTEGLFIPNSHRKEMEIDLKEEVLIMYRKKTYGYLSLADYRKKNPRG